MWISMEKYVKIETLEEFVDTALNDCQYYCSDSMNYYNSEYNSKSSEFELSELKEISDNIKSGVYYKKIEIKPLTWSEFVVCVIDNVALVYKFEDNYLDSGHNGKRITPIDFREELKVSFEKYDYFLKSDMDSEDHKAKLEPKRIKFSEFLKENDLVIQYGCSSDKCYCNLLCCEIKKGIFLAGTTVSCKKENELSQNLMECIKGKTLVKDAMSNNRKEIQVPENLIFDL